MYEIIWFVCFKTTTSCPGSFSPEVLAENPLSVVLTLLSSLLEDRMLQFVESNSFPQISQVTNMLARHSGTCQWSEASSGAFFQRYTTVSGLDGKLKYEPLGRQNFDRLWYLRWGCEMSSTSFQPTSMSLVFELVHAQTSWSVSRSIELFLS